jgi:hypothetical protein
MDNLTGVGKFKFSDGCPQITDDELYDKTGKRMQKMGEIINFLRIKYQKAGVVDRYFVGDVFITTLGPTVAHFKREGASKEEFVTENLNRVSELLNNLWEVVK